MENEKNQAPALSFKRYAVARLTRYISLLLSFILLFIPVLMVDEDEKISPIQFLLYPFTDGSDTTISVLVLLSLVWAVISAVTTITDGKEGNINHDKPNEAYIRSLYHHLPLGFELFDDVLGAFTITPILTMGSYYCIANDGPDLLLTILYHIILFSVYAFIRGNTISSFICIKDIRLIRQKNARFDDDQLETPTIKSDFQTIATLFGSTETASSDQSKSSTDVAEALREYKKLLDDGIITEEEFQAKKAELLHTSNDQKSE